MNPMMKVTLFSLLIILANMVVVTAHMNFVLVGATGNLANKYLWQALLAHMIEGNIDHNSISIFAGGTSPTEKGDVLIANSITNIKCHNGDANSSTGLWDYTQTQCEAGKTALAEVSRYVKIKTYSDYQDLNTVIQTQNDREGKVETTRIFYLSISPSLYESTVLAVHETGRPTLNSRNPDAQLRVVFEKPFGRNHASAFELSQLLQKHLTEEEIYRVDHYLGKEGVQAISMFRRLNLDLLHALQLPDTGATGTIPGASTASGDDKNTDISAVSPTRVTVSLVETEDVQGRSAYYDAFGVVRDVMQNHMTQALVYALMDFDDSPMPLSGEKSLQQSVYGELSDRLAVLHRLGFDPRPAMTTVPKAELGVARAEEARLQVLDVPTENAYWCGQYDDYIAHVQTDIGDNSYVTDTCTAARVRLQYNVVVATAAAEENEHEAGATSTAGADAADALNADQEKEIAKGLHSRSRKVANRARQLMAVAEAYKQQENKRAAEAQARTLFRSTARAPTRGMDIRFHAGKAAHQRSMSVLIANDYSHQHPHHNDQSNSNITGNAAARTTNNSNDISDNSCAVRYNVQGVSTSIELIGNCWASLHLPSPIRVPEHWGVDKADCTAGILANIAGLEEGAEEKAEVGATLINTTTTASASASGSERCTLTPLIHSSFSASSSSSSSHAKRLRLRPHNNAYIRVLGALFRNDKSMFVPTAELLAQWTLWDQVIESRNISSASYSNDDRDIESVDNHQQQQQQQRCMLSENEQQKHAQEDQGRNPQCMTALSSTTAAIVEPPTIYPKGADIGLYV